MTNPVDPLAGTNWSVPATVDGFARSAPNPVLMRYAEQEARRGAGRALDIGCGAGRNAVPLAMSGWRVTGTDLSWPMLEAGAARAAAAGVGESIAWVLAPMEALPVADRSADLIIAHGIWNLAPSAAVFRRALDEAARVARPAAGLFVFTFSRNTFPAPVAPVTGETFVFTEFSGEPQCFLTEDQLEEELSRVGFEPDGAVPLTEYNRGPAAAARVGGPPVIWEASFRFRG
jgi:ubiquinone/menaquinone biosynthesis C-methylase UbiE